MTRGQIQDLLAHALTDFSNAVRAHDLIHATERACPSLGGCVVRRARHEAEEELVDCVAKAIREGYEPHLILPTQKRKATVKSMGTVDPEQQR